jgi:hypothetical protein
MAQVVENLPRCEAMSSNPRPPKRKKYKRQNSTSKTLNTNHNRSDFTKNVPLKHIYMIYAYFVYIYVYILFYVSIWTHTHTHLFFGGTGVWTWGLTLARQTLYHLTQSPALFALIIFQIQSQIYVQACLHNDSLIYASHIAGVTGTYHTANFLLVKMGSHKLFLLGLPLNHDPPDLCLLSS